MDEKNIRILGPVDTAFLYVETPTSPMNIGAVSIFEGKIDFKEVLKVVDSRIHRAPIYQQKVVQAPLKMGQPMWVFDPDFHIENHVFKTYLEPPGTEEQLRVLVSHLLSSMLNRSKPLWEIHMIEGLEGDRTAFFFKVHHCMVDGLAAVELFTLLFDLTPDITPLEKKPLYDPPPIPEQIDLILDSIKQDLPHKWQVLKKIGHDLTTLGSVLLDKEHRRKTLYGMANLINDNLRPIRKLPINGKNSGMQELAWVEFSLAEVRAIKSNRGASINDVMLTVLTGAIERYVEEVEPDNMQEFFRVLVPVSMRMEKEKGDFGNRISVLPVDIPFSVKDPLERLDAVTEYTKVMKESSLSIGLDMLLTLPSLAPSFIQPLIWGAAPMAFQLLAHTWCTNVAGPMIPVYLRGHKLLKNYGFFPLNPSMGLACVIVSYNQRISMTLVSDKAIVPDVRQVQKHLQTAFEELRTAAKVQPMEPFDIEREPKKPAIKQPVMTKLPKGDASNNTAVAVVEEIQVEVADDNEEAVQSTPNNHDETNTDIHVKTEEEISVNSSEAQVPAGKPKLFSDAWAKAYMEELNNSQAYYDASTKWTAGSLAMIMEASPENGFPQATAVLLDLHKGKCRDARSLTVNQAHREAAFVLEGNHENWMKVLRGEAQPLAMIIRRKLKLKKGSIARLMPFTQSAQELIKCAQKIT
ncbi:MAG: wax ester/triacylglycerol synthase family O-acyltransferase [Chloroflexi bacterium]|nr:MAG: wax ester/triacylglycerol synthase family O-acyltransferase [Chloroflexota bacterium]